MLLNTGGRRVHTEMHLSGVDPNPQPGSEQAEKLAGVESTLRDQIIAAQQAKNGTPLTREEVQNLAMGYFADQVMKSGVFGMNGDGKQPQAQDGQNKDQDVPQEGKGAQSAGGPKLPQFNPAETLPHGAPVAAGTMADQGGGDAKAATSNLVVGDKKPHGVIAEGDTPDGRAYVVKAPGKGKMVDLYTISEETGCDFDQLKALNRIKRDGVWISNGTKLLLPPPPTDDPGHKAVIDIEKSTAVLNRKAKDKPTGYCSRAVFEAINAGRPADKHIDGPGLAKNAGPILEEAGFKKVLSSADKLASYTPRKGDVVVLQDYPHQGHYIDLYKDGKPVKDENGKIKQVWKDVPAGHIAMFDGKHWVSDYAQDKKYGSRIWAGEGFENNRVGMVVYRP